MKKTPNEMQNILNDAADMQNEVNCGSYVLPLC